jgi:hypothetical protein
MGFRDINIKAENGMRNKIHFFENKGRKKSGARIIIKVIEILPRGPASEETLA